MTEVILTALGFFVGAVLTLGWMWWMFAKAIDDYADDYDDWSDYQ